VYWLHDEIDREATPPMLPVPPAFWHRCLLSDGRVISIPLFDVVIQTFSELEQEIRIVKKRRA
jgi:hypothetical protein